MLSSTSRPCVFAIAVAAASHSRRALGVVGHWQISSTTMNCGRKPQADAASAARDSRLVFCLGATARYCWTSIAPRSSGVRTAKPSIESISSRA